MKQADDGFEFPMINRSAVMLEPTETFLEWVNGYPGDDQTLALDDLREDNDLFLIPEQETTPESWIKRNYKAIFEHALNDWYLNENYWPKDRSFKMFKKFFNIRFCSVVYDLSKNDLVKEDW